MSWNFKDANEPRWDWTRPPPRGLLPVPPEVEERLAAHEAIIARQGRSQFMTPEYRKRTLDAYTLEYYYDGRLVAARTTPQGVEVLAVGAEEIGQLLRSLSQEEILTVCIRTA
jgi:hypothetical protein